MTATATVRVKADIAEKLGITEDVLYFQSSYNRANLSYEIRPKGNFINSSRDIAELLQARFRDQSGIIYCKSVKDCEKLSEQLKRDHCISCEYYHAQMNATKR